jgi:3-hydroxyacyl-[acyl-carrier-protein] dehydratase
MRWMWIDRFTNFTSGQAARAVKNLSGAEDVLASHCPGYPIFPAALMLEGLAQTGGILVGEANQFREKVVLAKIPKAVFRREALAGEQLHYDVKVLFLKPEGAAIAGTVSVGTEIIAEAEIYFAHLDQNRAAQAFGERNFVFSGELKHLLDSARQVPPA